MVGETTENLPQFELKGLRYIVWPSKTSGADFRLFRIEWLYQCSSRSSPSIWSADSFSWAASRRSSFTAYR